MIVTGVPPCARPMAGLTPVTIAGLTNQKAAPTPGPNGPGAAPTGPKPEPPINDAFPSAVSATLLPNQTLAPELGSV